MGFNSGFKGLNMSDFFIASKGSSYNMSVHKNENKICDPRTSNILDLPNVLHF